MAELIGGIMMTVGGVAMSAGSIQYVRAHLHRPLDTARQLVGDSTAAVPKAIPADMAALLDQIP